MLEYVKICPKCGHENPEDEAGTCKAQGCDQFLGMVEPVPRPNIIQETLSPYPESPEDRPNVTEHFKDGSQESVRVTNRFKAVSALYLDLPGTEQIYPIQSGFVLGQAHPTSTADIQLVGIQGVNFIHRRHCSFDYTGDCWNVTTIPQEEFTNPTLVNHIKLQPGQKYPIRNGDRLTLCNITFNVRIIQS